MMSNFRFTVFTPTYNSAACIQGVYESLSKQSFQNFEWLVVDDCSPDNTLEVLHRIQSEAKFSMRIIRNPENRMLMFNYNLAAQEAKGELFLPAGHDDEFDANALEVFSSNWDQIPAEQRHEFSGVTCLCRDSNGAIVGDPFPTNPWDANIFEQIYKKRIGGEKWGFTRTDVMQQFPFPDYDRYVPETLIWYRIGAKYKTRYINTALRTYHHSGAETHLSNSLNKYPVGRFEYYLEIVNNYLGKIVHHPPRALGYVALVDYFRHKTGQRWSDVFRRLRPVPKLLWLAMSPAFVLTRYLIERRGK